MSKVARALAATTLAFGSLFFATPAQADWTGTNVNVVNGSVQFDYRGGIATQTLDVPTEADLTLVVNNTIANKIGWNGQVADSWTVSVNGNHFAGNEITSTTISVRVSGEVTITATGIDRGYWAGWYGPIISAPVLTYLPVAITDSVRTDSVRAEESPEPTPQPSPEPSPTPEPQPTPTATPPAQVESPQEPEPTQTPSSEPTTEPDPEPTEQTEPEELPSPEPTIEPSPEIEIELPTTPETESSVDTESPSLEIAQEQPIETAPEIQQVHSVLETSEPGSPEYQEALDQLMEIAQADDPELPTELANIPVVGAIASAVLDAFNDLGNLGSDMSPKQREQAKKEVVASIAIGQAVISAGVSYRRGV